MDDAAAMALALEEARRRGRRGEVPVGAVVLVDGAVVARAGNRRERDQDPTAHAELLALRAAAAALGLLAARRRHARGHPRALPDVRRAPSSVPVSRASSTGRPTPRTAPAGRSTTCASTPASTTRWTVVHGVEAEAAGRLLDDFFATRRG